MKLPPSGTYCDDECQMCGYKDLKEIQEVTTEALSRVSPLMLGRKTT